MKVDIYNSTDREIHEKEMIERYKQYNDEEKQSET